MMDTISFKRLLGFGAALIGVFSPSAFAAGNPAQYPADTFPLMGVLANNGSPTISVVMSLVMTFALCAVPIFTAIWGERAARREGWLVEGAPSPVLRPAKSTGRAEVIEIDRNRAA